jgi:phosphoribosyl 1,2-cyclic phosphodiesterase
MRIKFWGVRGSVPCPGPHTAKYGGNTACIELRFDEADRLVIIDAGSGIRELGNFMMGNDLPKGPMKADIFLSHTHWDHIMGFPFFTPIYIPGTRLTVFGPVSYENEPLDEIVGGQLTYRYFPVRQSELAADIKYISLKEDRMDIGDDIILSTKFLNHPILCLGFRFEYQGKIFCTVYDTEVFRNIFSTDTDDPSYDEAMAMDGELAAREENHKIEQFFKDADLVVYDAQYTKSEYEDGKVGWGHNYIEQAIESSQRANVKRLALFHHDPDRTDKEMDVLSKKYCRPENNNGIEIFFAKEGMEIHL